MRYTERDMCRRHPSAGRGFAERPDHEPSDAGTFLSQPATGWRSRVEHAAAALFCNALAVLAFLVLTAGTAVSSRQSSPDGVGAQHGRRECAHRRASRPARAAGPSHCLSALRARGGHLDHDVDHRRSLAEPLIAHLLEPVFARFSASRTSRAGWRWRWRCCSLPQGRWRWANSCRNTLPSPSPLIADALVEVGGALLDAGHPLIQHHQWYRHMILRLDWASNPPR